MIEKDTVRLHQENIGSLILADDKKYCSPTLTKVSVLQYCMQYCRNRTVATVLLQQYCCNGTVATVLLQQDCCNRIFATVLLQHYCCNNICATVLLQQYCCNSTVAIGTVAIIMLQQSCSNRTNSTVALLLLQQYCRNSTVATVLLQQYFCNSIVAIVLLQWYCCNSTVVTGLTKGLQWLTKGRTIAARMPETEHQRDAIATIRSETGQNVDLLPRPKPNLNLA